MKFVASKNLKRAGATALIAVATLAATGCTYTNDPATTIVYDASDGVSFTMWPEGKRVDMRNLLIISAGEGQPGRVLGTVYNTGDSQQTVTFNVGGGESFTLTADPGQVIKLEDEANQVIIPSTSKAPGLTIEAEGVIGETTEAFNLPVLDGTLPEYTDYVPGGSTAAPAETATPTETAVPAMPTVPAETVAPAEAVVPAETATATATY
ncbi:hypothetical protein A7979_10960 [Rothia nasimurium]|uniref:DNA modification methylase n=1 Tax=Rothia nasimurium TaxID=85336 RepID=A0A1Y1RQ47_9MICC|nr:hypothetical protein [Rothia nasimurium]ORC20636.1 hypothetical protein A7979_10960 [Rothia nasimurium]